MTERHQVTYRIPRTAAPKETRGRAPARFGVGVRASRHQAVPATRLLQGDAAVQRTVPMGGIF